MSRDQLKENRKTIPLGSIRSHAFTWGNAAQVHHKPGVDVSIRESF
jgi:hypothetical protein